MLPHPELPTAIKRLLAFCLLALLAACQSYPHRRLIRRWKPLARS